MTANYNTQPGAYTVAYSRTGLPEVCCVLRLPWQHTNGAYIMHSYTITTGRVWVRCWCETPCQCGGVGVMGVGWCCCVGCITVGGGGYTIVVETVDGTRPGY